MRSTPLPMLAQGLRVGPRPYGAAFQAGFDRAALCGGYGGIAKKASPPLRGTGRSAFGPKRSEGYF